MIQLPGPPPSRPSGVLSSVTDTAAPLLVRTQNSLVAVALNWSPSLTGPPSRPGTAVPSARTRSVTRLPAMKTFKWINVTGGRCTRISTSWATGFNPLAYEVTVARQWPTGKTSACENAPDVTVMSALGPATGGAADGAGLLLACGAPDAGALATGRPLGAGVVGGAPTYVVPIVIRVPVVVPLKVTFGSVVMKPLVGPKSVIVIGGGGAI